MPQPVFEFGEFRLDPEERLLLRRGQPVPLTPKALETLLTLVESRDRVVEKAELMRRLWPDHVVDEANLTQQIFTLRKALGDDPEGNLFIDNVPRHGYRFVAHVRVPEPIAAPAPGAPAQKRPSRSTLLLAIAGVAALAALGYVAYSRSRVAGGDRITLPGGDRDGRSYRPAALDPAAAPAGVHIGPG